MTTFSFLLPTRGRPQLVKRFLESLLESAAQPRELEVVLAVDEDDPASQGITFDKLRVLKVTMPPGSTMGSLNRACFASSSGRFVMLINDDVIVRTPKWDEMVGKAFASYEDDVALIHVNDLLFRDKLCTFPMVSRKACQAIGVCPPDYRRYRIDDHIYDTYNILAHLGHGRITYLEDVIFEHENYLANVSLEHKLANEQMFESLHDSKVYLPRQEIIAQDADFFARSLDGRKKDAIRLAELIDECGDSRRRSNYQELLSTVKDSYGYRKTYFVNKVSTRESAADRAKTTTIAVVTSDFRKPHARKCLSLIKRHTQNFDLIILDNDNDRDFNHSREINKVLRFVKTDYLVLMDDDVFVEESWLDGLLRSVDENTGVVTPLHKDRRGHLSYSGVYLKGDGLGTHAHTFDRPVEPRVVQCICSAVMLINMKKCSKHFFSTSYHKYFLDLDYSLRIWEDGLKVICTPHTIVTHLGGGTLSHGSELSESLVKADCETFVETWIASAKLRKISENTWSRFEYLRTILDIPKQIEECLSDTREMDFESFKRRVDDLVAKVLRFPLFCETLVCHLAEHGSRCEQDGRRAEERYCEVLARKLIPRTYSRLFRRTAKKALLMLLRASRANPTTRRWSAVLRRGVKSAYQRYQRLPGFLRWMTDRPIRELKQAYERAAALERVVGTYQGYRIVEYKGLCYGIPTSLGAVDITRDPERRRPGIIASLTSSQLKDSIDEKTGVVGDSIVSPRLLGSYKGYNLVTYGMEIYGIPIRLGTVDLTIDDERRRPEIIKASTVEGIRERIRGLVDGGDLERERQSPPQGVFHCESVSCGSRPLTDMKERTRLRVERSIARWIEAYRGFNVFFLEGRYFALPVDEGTFSVELMKSGRYNRCVVGHSLPESRRGVDEASCANGDRPSVEVGKKKERALFVGNVLPPRGKAMIDGLQGYDISVLAPKTGRGVWGSRRTIEYLDSAGRRVNSIGDSLPATRLVEDLKGEKFDLVIIPYEGRKYWQNTNLELLAGTISNQMMVMFEGGSRKTRIYRGEDIHRIQYNKSYLNSMFRFVGPLKGKRLLEIGCSDGLACDLLLSEEPQSIAGIDTMEAVGCSYPHAKIEYFNMDGANMLFEDQTFDLCYSIATLEHCQDPAGVLHEMKRVAKKGGYCYVQAGPLYWSPFGHHMFGYFDDYPWIHVRLSEDEIVKHAKENGVDQKVKEALGLDIGNYVHDMLKVTHINGKLLKEYGLEKFMQLPDIQVLQFSRSYEGKDLLTDEVSKELERVSREDLISHGFELIFRVK